MAKKISTLIRYFYLYTLTSFLSGCSSLVVLHPKGEVGLSERELIIIAVALMLIVVIPAILMTLIFAWRFRSSNKNAKYIPHWYSKKVEMGIWVIPAIITVIIAIITWDYSHKLDPYQPLKSDTKPLVIQVISLDWKWLFIYPEQQIATINHIVIPAGVPIRFYITSDQVMNSFFIPQLGSQIMTMPGMKTQLNLMANQNGSYQGMSANFSGEGFNGMNFTVDAVSPAKFQEWLNIVKQSANKIDYASYKMIAKPSSNNPVAYFSSAEPGLFDEIVNEHMNMKIQEKN